jgi:hypothetical protein
LGLFDVRSVVANRVSICPVHPISETTCIRTIPDLSKKWRACRKSYHA